MATRRVKKVIKGTYKRAKVYGPAAYQLYKDVNYVKSMLNVEKKYIDTLVNSQDMDTTGAIQLLNGCTQGTSGTTRNGQSIKMCSIEMRGIIALDPDTVVGSICKVAIVLDTQPNAGAPTIANIWSSAFPTALRLIGTGKRFRILYSKCRALSINGNEVLYFKWFKKLKIHTRYNTGNVGDITDITTNSLYLIYSSTDTTDPSLLTVNIRVRFIDN